VEHPIPRLPRFDRDDPGATAAFVAHGQPAPRPAPFRHARKTARFDILFGLQRCPFGRHRPAGIQRLEGDGHAEADLPNQLLPSRRLLPMVFQEIGQLRSKQRSGQVVIAQRRDERGFSRGAAVHVDPAAAGEEE